MSLIGKVLRTLGIPGLFSRALDSTCSFFGCVAVVERVLAVALTLLVAKGVGHCQAQLAE